MSLLIGDKEMTVFIKDEFVWDGSYLMYRGGHSEGRNMEVAHPDCHPSWIGKPEPEFIARFKYGYKPWKAWVNFLVKHQISVERYIRLSRGAGNSPVHAMRALGYKGKV